jgi:hypothetical protein
MSLSRDQRRFLIINYLVVSAVLDFLIGAGIARLLYRSHPPLPLQPSWVLGADPYSVGGDLFTTAFLLPLMTAWIVAPFAAAALRTGFVEPFKSADAPGLIRLLAAFSPSGGGALLGVLAMPLFALPIAWWLAGQGIEQLPYASMFWLKSLFSAALGAVLTPWIAWAALLAASEKEFREQARG